MDIPFGSTGEQHPGRSIDWVPLMIVIGSVYLISSALVYSMSGYFGNVSDFRIESTTSIILGFLAATIFIVAIACVVYAQVNRAKRLFVIGMVIVIILLAIRTEVFLREIW